MNFCEVQVSECVGKTSRRQREKNRERAEKGREAIVKTKGGACVRIVL